MTEIVVCPVGRGLLFFFASNKMCAVTQSRFDNRNYYLLHNRKSKRPDLDATSCSRASTALPESAKEEDYFTAATARDFVILPPSRGKDSKCISAIPCCTKHVVAPSLSIECALDHIEGLSFICGMVTEEQIRPNLRCGVSVNPIFLSKIIQYGVSAAISKY